MSRKVVYHKYGDPEKVLQVENGPEPTDPGPEQVLIKVTVSPVHNGDLLVARGGHDPVPRPIPSSGFISGCEGLGIVEKVGPVNNGAHRLRVGDRVAFFAVGSWQEKLVIPAEYASVVPEDLENELAAQLHINPIAAMLLTRLVSKLASQPQSGVLRVSAVEADLKDLSVENNKNEKVVLLSVAGSMVAQLAASILKKQGFTPVGLVRSSTAAMNLQEATGIPVIGYDRQDWQEDVRRVVNGRNIFAGLDAVGGKIGEQVLSLLSPGGTLVSYGSLTTEPIPVDHVHLCMTAKTICGVGMVHWTQLPQALRAADITALILMIRDNRRLFKVAGKFPLAEVGDAVRLFRQPARDGTVLLSIG